MKSFILISTALLLTACQQSAVNNKISTTINKPILTVKNDSQRYTPDTLLVSFDKNQKTKIMQQLQQQGYAIISEYTITDAVAIRVPKNTDILLAMRSIKQISGVLNVERDNIVTTQ
ncbi:MULTISPECIES: hypothetical protein [unclassified Acinetobacter]|uniref:S8 family serine peptidase n=1 Tax=unclassified Acinetobacter TaxID=196816 RepID=UPI0035B72E1A